MSHDYKKYFVYVLQGTKHAAQDIVAQPAIILSRTSRYLDGRQDINVWIFSLTRITEEIKNINTDTESRCQMKESCCD